MNQGFYNYQPYGIYSGNVTAYQNIPNNTNVTAENSNQDDRIGFLGPFLLGGLVGGAVAPAFWNRPYYYPYPIYRPYPYPYPYYY